MAMTAIGIALASVTSVVNYKVSVFRCTIGDLRADQLYI